MYKLQLGISDYLRLSAFDGNEKLSGDCKEVLRYFEMSNVLCTKESTIF